MTKEVLQLSLSALDSLLLVKLSNGMSFRWDVNETLDNDTMIIRLTRQDVSCSQVKFVLPQHSSTIPLTLPISFRVHGSLI